MPLLEKKKTAKAIVPRRKFVLFPVNVYFDEEQPGVFHSKKEDEKDFVEVSINWGGAYSKVAARKQF